MPETLLSTKLYIPRSRVELVPRPRLIERLDAGLQGKLTLISAPAGYGKTTLVSDWIARSGIPAAWLSLDAADNDVARFFSYVVAALQAAVPSIDPALGAAVGRILETDSDPPIERLLTTLLNDVVAYKGHIVLVLDDYHLIHQLQIHRALDFMLDHLPPPAANGGMHIVLISRANPPMPLGRLRVQGLLTEIREADLRFTPDEATAFLNERMGLGLSGAEIERLEASTEGWVAGLQLAALTIRDRANAGERIAALTGSHRHLIEYLVHEVMTRQTEEVRTFLLRTSILKRFSASLCDAVLDGGRRTKDEGQTTPHIRVGDEQLAASSAVLRPSSWSAAILEHLERANLFLVPLDDERRWYRYHHLFADFLRRRLHRLQPEIVPELYTRASQWYEAQGMVDEAIEHALAGEDVTRAARLLDDSVEGYILSNAAVSKVLRWADRLPGEERAKFPRLCIYYAWALMFEWRLDAVERALALAEAHLNSTAQATKVSPSPSFSAAQIVGHARAIRIYVASRKGEHNRVVDLALATLKTLPEAHADSSIPTDGRHPADEMRILRGIVMFGLGQGYFDLGQMEAADQALESALALCQGAGARYAALGCILYLMQVQAARGALRRAIANGEKGLLWVQEWSGPAGQGGQLRRVADQICRELGSAHYERNELEQAAANLHKAVETFELAQSLLRVSVYVLLVRLHHALGSVDAAQRTLQRTVHVSLTPGLVLLDIPLEAQIAELCLLLSQSRPELNDLFVQAVEWADGSGLQPEDDFRYEQEYDYLTLARVRVAQGRAEEVLPLLTRLVAAASRAGRKGQLIAYLALQAVAHHACGRANAALAALSRSLALGEPEGYVRTFLDLGPPMHELLQQTLARGVAIDYVDKLLSSMEGTAKDIARTVRGQQTESPMLPQACHPSSIAHTDMGRPSSPYAHVGIEPLNDREMQILRLLAADLSDREIAEHLYLSINTVKWYNRQIYGKLGVRRRDRAVARALELGILRDA